MRHPALARIVWEMCGRYVLTTPGEVLAQVFDTTPPPEELLAAIVPRYNIAPTQRVPIVRKSGASPRELAIVRWGLVPTGPRTLRSATI